MQPLKDESVRLFFISGVALLVLSFIGVFMLALLTVWGVSEKIWDYYFFYLLNLAVSGIAVYYVAVGLIGWLLLRKKKRMFPQKAAAA